MPEYKEDIYFSGMFTFGESIQNHIFINEVFLENLTVLRISSDKTGFKDGYYKIIGDKFDYKYINDLMINKD